MICLPSYILHDWSFMRYKMMAFWLLAGALVFAGCSEQVTDIRTSEGVVGTVGEADGLVKFLLQDDNKTVYTCSKLRVDTCALIKPGKSVRMTVGKYNGRADNNEEFDNFVQQLEITKQ